MYQLVYDMCNAIPRPFTDRLFAGVADYLDKHTVRVCEEILSHNDIATAYAREFERFELAAGDISRGCDYLNRLISQTGMGSGPDRRLLSSVANTRNKMYKLWPCHYGRTTYSLPSEINIRTGYSIRCLK